MTYASRTIEKLRNAFRRGQRGTSTLEFTLAAIPLLLVIFAVVDFSRGVYEFNAINDMARSGARYAIVHGSKSATPAGPAANSTAVTTAARSKAVSLTAANAAVTSTWLDGTNTPGSRVRVNVTYPYVPIVARLFPFGTLTLQSSSTMVVTN